MRWRYRDRLLLWLFPVAYAAHIVEELAGGFRFWVARLAGAPLPLPAFLAINTVAFVLLVAGIRAAIRREEHGWIAVAVATVVVINGVLHLLGTLVTQAYSPGLVTGIVLYMPLGTLTLIRAWDQAPAVTRRRGVWAGIGIHLAVTVLAYAFTRP